MALLVCSWAWQRCLCWLLYTNWGNSCKKYPTLSYLCRDPPGDVGGVTDLKKNLKNGWFGAVQVWEVTAMVTGTHTGKGLIHFICT